MLASGSGSNHMSRPVSPALTDVGGHDAIPDCIMPQDLGDLLLGIGADELDDFGDMDGQELTAVPDLHDELEEDWDGGPPMPVTMGFATGGGRQLALPSSTALARARKMWDDEDMVAGPSASQDDVRDAKRARIEPPSRPSPATGFTTGQGTPVAPPSRAARDRADRLLEDLGVTTPAATSLGFKTGSGKPAANPRSESLARAMQLFGEFNLPDATPTKPRTGMPAATPSRPPLAVTTNTFSTPKPIQIKTPLSSVRRIGLGGTLSQARAKRTFVTPFKKVISAPSAVVSPPKPVFESVFDLTPVAHRANLKNALLHPQYYPVVELKEMKIPNEIWIIDLENAKDYQFVMDDEKIYGAAEAYTLFQSERCQLATMPWVENHWCQILWKLAGQIQARPSLFEQMWTLAEVIAQLKYRYEREFGCAQRPIIRRIQEHDSSPGTPMILVVSGVKWSSEEDQKPRPHLELTDGWYRIRAQVDECLARAIRKGRIIVGRKMAITGAKLESASEGSEVLKAFETSHLTITGNSTCLARWHRKLGAQSIPFIANLSSLSVDGGVIAVMDIIIDKVFPLAYTNTDRDAKEPPWNEDEELARQEQWKERYQAQRSQLEEKMQKELEKLEDVAAQLASYAEDVGEVYSEPPDTIDNDLDTLLMAKDNSNRIRNLPAQYTAHLARHAAVRIGQEIQDKQVKIEADLRIMCPPRSVRDFRMIRFRDAQQGIKEPFRAGMLNAWEAKVLEDLKEGQRYLISNLIPSRSGDWSLSGRKTEIYLHSRRDTRWQLIE